MRPLRWFGVRYRQNNGREEIDFYNSSYSEYGSELETKKIGFADRSSSGNAFNENAPDGSYLWSSILNGGDFNMTCETGTLLQRIVKTESYQISYECVQVAPLGECSDHDSLQENSEKRITKIETCLVLALRVCG